MNALIKYKALLALLLTSIIWGSTWVVSKIGVQQIPGLALSAIRQCIAGFLVVSFFLLRGEKLPNLKQFKWLISMCLLTFVFANGMSTWGVKYIPSGMAALLAALYPLFVVIIEWIFFQKRNYSLLTFIGLLVGLAGIVLVLYGNTFHHSSKEYVFGIILSLLSVVSWSLATIYVSRNKYQMNAYYTMGWQMLCSSVFIYLIGVFTGNTVSFSQITLSTWGVILYLVFIGSIVAFAAFIYSVKNLAPAIASLYAYFNPIVAAIIGYFLLNEKLTINIFLGTVVTLLGVYLVNYSLKRAGS